MCGVFAQWQPAYSAHAIPTFPVKNKKPAVKGYLTLGLASSDQLRNTDRFRHAEALGFAPGPKTGITVLDIDTPDERVLTDALGRHGHTPIVVRSGSGNWHAWYRHSGEGRHLRPFPDLPIDILGNGYVVGPPSKGAKGQYAFIEGGLDDLDRLPCMQNLEGLSNVGEPYHNALQEIADEIGIPKGARNTQLWKHSMRQARYCDDFNALLDVAMTFNDQRCLPPLGPEEVTRTANSAWSYQKRGENWFGSRGMVSIPTSLLEQLKPDESHLYLVLRRAHEGIRETFAIAIEGD